MATYTVNPYIEPIKPSPLYPIGTMVMLSKKGAIHVEEIKTDILPEYQKDFLIPGKAYKIIDSRGYLKTFSYRMENPGAFFWPEEDLIPILEPDD